MKMPGVDPFYMVLMSNSLKVEPGNKLIYHFDLKGSLYQRKTINSSVMRNFCLGLRDNDQKG